MWLRSYHLAGLIGISVYLPLIAYVISEIKPIVSIRDRKNKFFNYKVSFHVIFFIASFSESFYSLSMLILNRVTVWGYVFRIFSLLLTVVYFSMIVNLWGYTLNYEYSAQNFYRNGALTIGANTVAAGVALYYLGVSRGYYQFTDTVGFIFLLLTHSLSLLFFALYLLTYGQLIKSKITQPFTSSVDSSNVTRILQILQRINSIMTICSLCYSFRIAVMSIKLYALFFDRENVIPTLTPPVWFLITDILPTLLPNLSFLYVMKIASISSDISSSAGEASALPSYHNRSWFYQDVESSSPLIRESEIRGSLPTQHLGRRLLAS